MFYTGTYEQCLAYDQEVTSGEGYVQGDNWSNPIKHYNQELWAVHAHTDYPSNMEAVDNIYHFQEPISYE